MIEKRFYNSDFYAMQMLNSGKSAEIIVPILIELFKPFSVIDIGCGLGTWLKVFIDNGIADVLGIDGDHVDMNKLYITKEQFATADLKTELNINRKFDLVISLEVAEHLPEESADNFINSLSKLGDIIYFSAAVPFQGGTNHINEQWQSYWAQKFIQRNFLIFDIIRRKVWTNRNVQPCYAQNGIIYINKNRTSSMDPRLFSQGSSSDINSLSLVHPEIFESIADPAMQTVRNQFNFFTKVLKNRIAQRLSMK
jgi:SAM-dependent methyltransferase